MSDEVSSYEAIKTEIIEDDFVDRDQKFGIENIVPLHQVQNKLFSF
jgi:hypothetical protein